ncbi:MAG TPA: hypothetical protein VIF10_03930 [Methylobacter sp.]|jgi:3-mercaptopyruvate sulfurtransferase SseA
MACKTNVETGKNRKLIYSSGVSAALLLLALYQIGIHEIILFDCSWAEWGVANQFTPANKVVFRLVCRRG